MTPQSKINLSAIMEPISRATNSPMVLIDHSFRIAWASESALESLELPAESIGSLCPESLQGRICSGSCQKISGFFSNHLSDQEIPYPCLESSFGQININTEKITTELIGYPYLLKSFQPFFQETPAKHHQHTFVASREWAEPFLEKLTRIAKTEIPVLLIGETGTGKECLARLIHERSRRARGPFVALDLSVIPETLVEDALFGHQRGAFTGAVSSQSGRLSRAHGGTLFIDEIENIPPAVQTRLLRFLEDGIFEPMGSSQSQSISTRIIAATNEDPEKLLREGRMRADLFYRLNGLSLHIPPLRKRTEDLPILIEHFRDIFQKQNRISSSSFSPEAMQVLSAYHFPGNIRELKHLVESVLAVSDPHKPIESSDLPESVRKASDRFYSRETTVAAEKNSFDEDLPDPEIFERRRIEKALRSSKGKIEGAASILGISRITLWRHMKRLNMKQGMFHSRNK